MLETAEENAILRICIHAAFADGALSEGERDEIKRIAARFSTDGLNLSSAWQEALTGKSTWRDAAAALRSKPSKETAYEMAVCICNADRAESEKEREFLGQLHAALQLDPGTRTFEQNAAAFQTEAMQAPPVIASAAQSELESMILNRAILAGALELMPQTLATMAILPVQLRMVYCIGKAHGYDLNWAHAKEFAAAAGIGMASQMVEGYIRRVVTGLTGRFAGKISKSMAGQLSDSALAFATTYALGHAALRYYSGGRVLSTSQLRELFTSMLAQGNSVRTQYAGDILNKSRSLGVADLLPLVKNS